MCTYIYISNMCVCIHIHIGTSIYTWYMHTHTYMCTCMHSSLTTYVCNMCIYGHTYAPYFCMHVCNMCVFTYKYTWLPTYICGYIQHIYMHVCNVYLCPHMHTCCRQLPTTIHTYIYVDTHTQYFISVHLYSAFKIWLFCRFSNIPLQFSCLGHFAYCVIPLFLRESDPLPDKLPREHRGLPSHIRQYIFIIRPFSAALTWTLTHGRYKYGGWTCSSRPHLFFYVHQSHRSDSTHPILFYEFGTLWKPPVFSYDVSHSRTWITFT